MGHADPWCVRWPGGGVRHAVGTLMVRVPIQPAAAVNHNLSGRQPVARNRLRPVAAGPGSAAGYSRDDGDSVAVGHLCCETVEEAHVVVADEDVHEASQCTGLVEDALTEAGM